MPNAPTDPLAFQALRVDALAIDDELTDAGQVGPELAAAAQVYLRTPRALIWRAPSPDWRLFVVLLPLASRLSLMANPVFAQLAREWGLGIRFIGVDAQQVERCGRYLVDQLQRRKWSVGDAGRRGEIVGGAQRHQSQRGQRVGGRVAMRQRGGDLTQGAVPAGRNHRIDAVGDGLGDIALGIAVFPGDAHLQGDARLAQGLHGRAQVIVTGRFTVEDQAPVRWGHRRFLRGRTRIAALL